jgi:oligoendopeptidase F
MNTTDISTEKRNSFLPDNITINKWEDIEVFFSQLIERPINSTEDLEQLLTDRSDLLSTISEDFAWRYIKMNIDTGDEALQKDFENYVTNIQPKTVVFENKLNTKIYESPYFAQLGNDYKTFKRGLKRKIELFREENIPIQTELSKEEQKFGAISSLMTVEHNGKELTIQQASKLLKENDRELRKTIFEKIGKVKLENAKKLDDLLDSLIKKRHQMALNAGYKNYRDYKFDELERFDYKVEDCLAFHDAVATQVVPLLNEWAKQRKEKLKLDVLKPYDLDVDENNGTPLNPFETTQEFIDKTKTALSNTNPYFGECLSTMEKMGRLDLDSKPGKAPGGFNYPLYKSGYPFIYMNAVGTHRDIVTLFHEAGHAVHSCLTHPLSLVDFKSFPSEVAELASMSMELMSMDNWHLFYNDEELKRAKIVQIKGVLETLPMVARIDKFQHWLYTHPEHTAEDRTNYWLEITEEFGLDCVDWSGYEDIKKYAWQKVLHIYEVPFYYIEYGFAQLGAIAVWRNYCNNKQKAIESYQNALKLGYTKTIGEIYNAADIQFNFSSDYVKELVDFVNVELKKVDS